MISLSIVFGPASGGAWGFMFQNKRNADVVLEEYNTGTAAKISIADDFGQRAVIVRNSIYGILIEDMDIAADAVIERSLHQARTQVRANNKSATDSLLKNQGMFNCGKGPLLRPHQ